MPPTNRRHDMTENTTQVTAQAPPPSLLCVGQEPGILLALKQLFQTKGFKVRTAASGQAALDFLVSEPADVVIVERRMVPMDGAAFLAQVHQRWPDTKRLLLSDDADVAWALAAIDQGQIYRYVVKPWDNNDMVLIVRAALQERALELECRQLRATIAQRNDKLESRNVDLEALVHERTTELEKSLQAVRASNERQKINFITSIKVFTNLIELRNSNVAGHSRRVADLCRRIAVQMKLDSKIVNDVFVAGLLHEVGKVGFADDMMDTPVVMLNTKQLEQFRKHPLRAAELLMPLAELRGSNEMIATQLERFDGAGYPNRLAGEQVPIGARILIVACDYDSLQIGLLGQRKMTPEQAQKAITNGSGRRYDPAVIQAFTVLNGGLSREEFRESLRQECTLKSSNLLAGMVLYRDLITPSGMRMLSAGHILDDAMVRKIIDFERLCDLQLSIDIWQDTKP